MVSPRSAISGAAAGGEQADRGEHHGGLDGGRGRVCERVARAKSAKRSRSGHRAPGAPGPAHAARHPVDQADQHRVGALGRDRVAPERPLRADRPAAAPDLHAAGVAAVGDRVEVAAGGAAEQRLEGRPADGRQVADRGDAVAVQLARGHLADAPEHLDGQRVQEVELAADGHDEQAVGLGDAAGDLGEELGGARRPR